MFPELSELLRPGLLRLIDYPVMLEGIERPGDNQLKRRHTENGVLLRSTGPVHDEHEIYLTRSGRLLQAHARRQPLPEGGFAVQRQVHYLDPAERPLSSQELARALLDRLDRALAGTREKTMTLRHKREQLARIT